MVIDHGDFRGSNAGILKFEGGALLAAEDDDVLTFHTDGTGTYKAGNLSVNTI